MPSLPARARLALRSFVPAGAVRDVGYGTIAWALLAYTFFGFLSEPLPLPTSAAPGPLGPLLGGFVGVLGVVLLVVLYRRDRFAWIVTGAFIGCPLAWVFAMGQHLPAVSARTQRDLRDDSTYQDAVERVIALTQRKGVVDGEARCRKLRLIGLSYAGGAPQDPIGLALRRSALIRLWNLGCATSEDMARALQELAQNGRRMDVPLGWFAPFRRARDRAVEELPLTRGEWCLNDPAWTEGTSLEQRQSFCQGQSRGAERSIRPPRLTIPGRESGR